MAPSASQHRRTHNLLLLNNLIGQQSTVSPFTLILDTLEQSARPLVAEYIQRAQDAKVRVVFVSFETLQKPQGVNYLVPASNQPLAAWQKQVASETQARQQRTLLVFDSLNVVAATAASQLPALLSSFLSPLVSLLAIYHTDVPVTAASPYVPAALDLFSFLATTVLTVYSLHHVLARKAARDRSVAEPVFGLDEISEGTLQGLGANSAGAVVLELEHRRKSGRGLKECYVLRTDSDGTLRQRLSLLEDYPGYKTNPSDTAADKPEENLSTFELGLTDKQRQDREGVVLPYFDAQKGDAQGGRILYDMGSEDDFDEEEDEI